MNKLVSIGTAFMLIGLMACTPKTPVIPATPAIADNMTFASKAHSNTPLQSDEGFAIYLTVYDIPPDIFTPDNQTHIVNEPVFSAKDIISYDAASHEITLTQTAMEKIIKLIVPIGGRSFAVCVDKKPVYTGSFWTPISSLAYPGIIIMEPLELREGMNHIRIDYRLQSLSTGSDPRSNPEIIESLRLAGKLK